LPINALEAKRIYCALRANKALTAFGDRGIFKLPTSSRVLFRRTPCHRLRAGFQHRMLVAIGRSRREGKGRIAYLHLRSDNAQKRYNFRVASWYCQNKVHKKAVRHAQCIVGMTKLILRAAARGPTLSLPRSCSRGDGRPAIWTHVIKGRPLPATDDKPSPSLNHGQHKASWLP
jgi:hypothetical protein